MPPTPDLLLGVAALVAVLGGYAAGSIPTARLVARAAGLDIDRVGERNPGSANVWKVAGPRLGAVTLAGDLAKGLLPAGIGVAAVGWGIGWLAGLGAILGHAWPALGRWRGGRAVATFSGACIGLLPVPAMLAIATLAVVAALVAAAGRNARVPAIAAGIGSLPVYVAIVERDPARLAAIGILYLATVARFVGTARRGTG